MGEGDGDVGGVNVYEDDGVSPCIFFGFGASLVRLSRLDLGIVIEKGESAYLNRHVRSCRKCLLSGLGSELEE